MPDSSGASVPARSPVLQVAGLNAFYGESHVLHDMALQVEEGELVVLLGRNGAGRTSTLRALLGVLGPTGRRSGSIRLRGQEVIDWPPHRIARLGVGYCPEERGIYASLNTEENLLLPPVLAAGGMSAQALYALFPNLAERRGSPGTRLSGGEQQMLALARVLRSGARLLLLDEISEGLAPVIVDKLAEVLQLLKQRGYTIVLVEQNFHFAEPLADRFLLVEHGSVVASIERDELPARRGLIDRTLGL